MADWDSDCARSTLKMSKLTYTLDMHTDTGYAKLTYTLDMPCDMDIGFAFGIGYGRPSIANLAPCSFSTLGMIINASDKIKTARVDQHMQ